MASQLSLTPCSSSSVIMLERSASKQLGRVARVSDDFRDVGGDP